jgi:hypothetical protein
MRVRAGKIGAAVAAGLLAASTLTVVGASPASASVSDCKNSWRFRTIADDKDGTQVHKVDLPGDAGFSVTLKQGWLNDGSAHVGWASISGSNLWENDRVWLDVRYKAGSRHTPAAWPSTEHVQCGPFEVGRSIFGRVLSSKTSAAHITGPEREFRACADSPGGNVQPSVRCTPWW